MPKSIEVSIEKYFSLPNPGLKSYFGRVREGNDQEYRTTFYSGTKLSEVLAKWMPTLDSLERNWPTLLQFEKDLAGKVGPMSIMKPLNERIDDIESYYEDSTSESEPITRSAVAAVLSEWNALRGMNLRSVDKTVDLMKKSTNSGSPYFSKRRLVTDKTIPYIVHPVDDQVVQDLHKWKGFACAVLGWRGQEGGLDASDVKQRVVWMFPYAVNISELQCYQPLIEGAQKLNLVPAWVSMDAVDECVTHMFDTKGKRDLIICTDFTKFDQHFGPSCQSAAKEILTGILSKGNAKDWLTTIFPIKYMIPLMYDYGKLYVGAHGMGSGSGGTNADETLVHRALQYEAAQSVSQKLNPYSQCLGDDGILTFPGASVDNVTRSYTKHGLEMNESKQYASEQDCTYLRRWYHQDYRISGMCRGVYATTRALGRLCEQERYYNPEIWGPKMVALRQLSIIENVKWHPLREQFVDYCMKGDKYRLGLDIPGFLTNISTIAKEANELMPEFLGYTKSQQKQSDSGIQNWWIVKYLNSMR